MTRVVAVVLLTFVVFACGDPVNVEKRMLPIGPAIPGLDLLATGGLAADIELKVVLQPLLALIKQIRKTLMGLNVCPEEHGGHKEGGYGNYEPGNEPNQVPDNEPDFVHIHDSGYFPSYRPSYRPSGQYRRGGEDASKVDVVCKLLKPLLKAIVKLLLQLEKTLGCMVGKDKDYKGDYKECQH